MIDNGMIMENKIKVSILCLTYNHAAFVREAFDGFLSQEVDCKYEIVVHDDASTDSTRDIINEYFLNYPGLIKKVFPEKNIHSAGGNVLKNAMEACNGEYIAFCEGDDKWIDPKKLKNQIEFLDANKEFVIAYSDCVPFNADGLVEINLNGMKRNLSQQELIAAPSIYTLTTCFRNVIKIPPEAAIARYGDLFMWTLLGQHGKGAYIESANPPMYRIHNGGMNSMKSRELKFEMLISTYSAIMMYYRRTGNNVCALKFRQLIMNAVIKYIAVKILIFCRIYNFVRLFR